MKAVKIALIIVFISLLIAWVRGGADMPIQQVFPLLGGHRPDIYDLAGIVMLLITCWGLKRLHRTQRNRSGRENRDYTPEDTDSRGDE